jgi:hypothetical protein
MAVEAEAVEPVVAAEPVVAVAGTVVALPEEWATAVAVTGAAVMVRAVMSLAATVTAWPPATTKAEVVPV